MLQVTSSEIRKEQICFSKFLSSDIVIRPGFFIKSFFFWISIAAVTVAIKAWQVYSIGLLKSNRRYTSYSVHPWISEEYRKIKRLFIVPRHTTEIPRTTRHYLFMPRGIMKCCHRSVVRNIDSKGRRRSDKTYILIRADTIHNCLHRSVKQASKFLCPRLGARSTNLFQELPNTYVCCN